jgi:Cu-processing system ATP-binding protein
VGPNGAGKTTLIKTILGLVKSDSGDISINDIHLNGNYEYRRQIGYMPQHAHYPEQMVVSDLFRFIEDIREEESVYKQDLIDEFNLEPELHKQLRVLSGGNKQKVGATLAMMFNPFSFLMSQPRASILSLVLSLKSG